MDYIKAYIINIFAMLQVNYVMKATEICALNFVWFHLFAFIINLYINRMSMTRVLGFVDKYWAIWFSKALINFMKISKSTFP